METGIESGRKTAAKATARKLQRLALGLLAAGMAAFSLPALAHDAANDDGVYRRTDLAELHAIVDHLREGAGQAQRARIDALVAAAAPGLNALNGRAIAAHRRKVGQMLREAPDAAALQRAQAEETRAADALSDAIDRALANLAATLTPAQRAQLREHAGVPAG